MTIITTISDFISGKVSSVEESLKSSLIFGNKGGSIKLKPESIDQMLSEIKRDLDGQEGGEEAQLLAKRNKPRFHEPMRKQFTGTNYEGVIHDRQPV